MCSLCGTDVKEKNLSQHLGKMHDLSRREYGSTMRRKTIWKISIPIAIILVIVLFVAGYNLAFTEESPDSGNNNKASIITKIDPEPDRNPNTNSPDPGQVVLATDFEAKDVMTGKTISLNQFRGSLVVLNFVNYGCSEDINKVVSAQLFGMKELLEEGYDFEPLSVFCGCCPEETLKDFASGNDFNWAWILDTDYSIITPYNDYVSKYNYPTLVFIDEAGYIQDATGFLEKAELGKKINDLN